MVLPVTYNPIRLHKSVAGTHHGAISSRALFEQYPTSESGVLLQKMPPKIQSVMDRPSKPLMLVPLEEKFQQRSRCHCIQFSSPSKDIQKRGGTGRMGSGRPRSFNRISSLCDGWLMRQPLQAPLVMVVVSSHSFSCEEKTLRCKSERSSY